MIILSIKKSKEFKEINLKGKKFISHSLILLAKPTSQFYYQDLSGNKKNAKDFCRVGFTASKMVGNAVKRNFAKRRLRHAFQELFLEHAKNHFDYVIIARKEIVDFDFSKILTDLKFCLKKIHENKLK